VQKGIISFLMIPFLSLRNKVKNLAATAGLPKFSLYFLG